MKTDVLLPLHLPPLSLYIHIPWCVKKCPYCDFNSHTYEKTLPEQRYIDKLLLDFETELPYIQKRPLHSIFIGGGTPSLFSPKSFDYLLSQLAKHVTFKHNIEITLEANPGTFEQKKFAQFRQTGINRLSLGIQSFNDTHLKKLGRIHDHKEAKRAIVQARHAGFHNINLDLMYGLPEQTTQMAIRDLNTALCFEPEHISWYQLTIEPNTAFYSAPPPIPDEDHIWEIQDNGQNVLQKSGFKRYEISAWGNKDHRSLHNLNYWQFGDYIGIGAGAHGKITSPPHQTVFRYRKTRMPTSYLAALQPTVERRILNPSDLSLEFFMNTLRLVEGVPQQTFSQYTGLPLSCIEKKIHLLQKMKLLATTRHQLQPTYKGLLFLNDILSHFA